MFVYYEAMSAASTVVLVRPHCAFANPETAESNLFQKEATVELAVVQAEHDGIQRGLEEAEIQCIVLDGAPDLPDAVFPNNWFSTHEDGTLVVYPMLAENRRRETEALPILISTMEQRGFHITHTLDLRPWAQEGMFLEGTGSLVLDHRHRRAFACVSPRTHPEAVRRWCEYLVYEPVLFHAEDNGAPIYHTNVVMGIGDEAAVVCLEAVSDPEVIREALGDREVIEITRHQMRSFAGNVLFLSGGMVISGNAWDSLTEDQRAMLGRWNPTVISIPNIETVGGGSIRCTTAEVWLPGLGA